MSTNETAPKPRCPWCGKPQPFWAHAKRHVKNCEHGPRQRWRRNLAPVQRTVVEILTEVRP